MYFLRSFAAAVFLFVIAPMLMGAITTGDLLIAGFDKAQRGSILKVGGAFEAAGVYYSFNKDSGVPGAFAPGTPGLNGRIIDAEVVADAGCFPYADAAGTNSKYLGKFNVASTAVGQVELWDWMWINSGLVVTTTTAQGITPVALPPRDASATTNGVGVGAALLVTTATTQAGAVTTITMTYTDSGGVAGNTATIASFPATAVVGSVIPFQLAAGDEGVRSVQSVTLGTTLTAGALSLVLYRRIADAPITVPNVSTLLPFADLGMPKLFNGTCIIPLAIGNATTAMTINGTYVFIEG